MKETQTATSVRMPGAAAWEWWRKRPGEPVAEPADGPSGGSAAVYAIPSRQCQSVPVWVSSSDPEVIAQVLEVELERLGVPVPAGPGRHLAWSVAGSAEARRLVRAVVAPRTLDPAGAAGAAEWKSFVPAPLLRPARPRAIVLWQELGRWVAGFSREGQWVHFQELGRRGVDAGLLQDLRCLFLELDGRQMVDGVDSLVLWKDAANVPVPDDFPGLVEEILDLDFRAVEKPPPDLRLAEGFAMEPGEVAEARERRRSARRAARAAVAVAAVYALLVGAGVADLFRRQAANQVLREELERREPDAALVRGARDRWTAMEGALDVDRHPVEIFHRVASLFPGRGLRMTSFEITAAGQIVLRGEASNVPMAIRFKADLENSADLEDYEWEVPQPDITGDTAEFTAFGTWRYAAAAAEQAAYP